ncbi:gluconate 5-dehydrogenase/2-deoxy-D-gluconate 3-dehydrogenase [Sphingobacterium allocomposti]|uniref:Gluconate 5-dehydrogenase/2-deoxy-D-gluconate 3-dehydrogenase n=1 Tax=Sphingobacterium allocomposti TaxID=415956 RepID=A0A5S5D2G9_9SPHI|nr:SDR family oxidoreductase [Sphingobacterium composti Yoo et al. 2007 non Ten et al. 2007]TYP89336.1 gluconate 5-dehydrogenase/2-deoxy-D-gluconate 3-dehydrogenase [Sphingobacterium composti Yoo et al. 2007 non Ten et al. 2007]HLS95014.1 SDR family oxidoreductase [Sphingobacterium sp.]
MSYLEKIYSLNGLRVVVTGASSGLGLHQAVALANCGATVFALSRTGTPKVDINMPVPKNVHFGSLDVSSPTEIRQKIGDIGAAGGIDVLVNNAGITERLRAEDISEEQWRKIHDVNVDGVFWCSQAAYPFLKDSAHVGRIINIASMASYLGFSEVVPYSSSKSAVLGITRGLAVEWSKDNILVNSISPGWFPSLMSQQVMDADRKAKILNRMPLHRFGRPEELSAMTCFLASPAATYITGQDFSVDGGALAFGF